MKNNQFLYCKNLFSLRVQIQILSQKCVQALWEIIECKIVCTKTNDVSIEFILPVTFIHWCYHFIGFCDMNKVYIAKVDIVYCMPICIGFIVTCDPKVVEENTTNKKVIKFLLRWDIKSTQLEASSEKI